MGVYPPAYKPLESFRDCDVCPEMVVIPAGSFLMGSPPNEEGRSNDEGPQHAVTLKSFALGRYEVTFDEWNACVGAGGCNGYRPKGHGWGQGKRPVTNVSWRDARAYADWLAKKTGKTYRLPSEAEWEYAARAGTTTPFYFGATITTDQANYNGESTYAGGPNGVYRKQTVPVGSFPANSFGLYDMHGNVSEWVEDLWHETYSSAPSDGSAWTAGKKFRVRRGGSWYTSPRNLRSASRDMHYPDYRDMYLGLGFRVARTLD